eukprot:scaffold53352_cov57-Attheya_sp.AAC.1
MWCGKCYISEPEVKFHVRTVADEDSQSETDPFHKTRLAKAWGGKHRSPNDFLVVRKLRYCSPDPTSPSDKLLEACIRHNLRRALAYSATVGLPGPYMHDGPLPDYDHCGYEVAIQMLLYSRSRGNHFSDYMIQFDSIRKFRSAYGNFLPAAPQANRVPISLGDQTGRYQLFSTDPCGSLWFARFMSGTKYRMGQDWRPNDAMSMDLLHAVINAATLRAQDASRERERHRWIVFRAYV